MNLYKRFIWPVLAKGDAETVHERTLFALEAAQATIFGRISLNKLRGSLTKQSVKCFGLTFPNALGMAAGFDKDVRVARGLAALGFGHIEVGTLTPRPQKGNPKPRIFRLSQDGALINRMGFPNGGVDGALPRLRRLAALKREFIVGVSLGKQKETPLDDAADDYVEVMQKVYAYSDYLAVNISSPNTPGLRKLQGSAYINAMLNRLQAESHALANQHGVSAKPLLLKIAPDLSWEELDAILEAATTNKIDGIIASNTTLSRAGLSDPQRDEKGGMSGLPLRERSNEVITYIAQRCDLPIIGVGGVRNSADFHAKLNAGATLVQLYTGLVYEGPSLPGRILKP